MLDERPFAALAPRGVAPVAVGEDLVDHALFVPGGTKLAGLEDGDLERRAVRIGIHLSHAAGLAFRGTEVEASRAIGSLHGDVEAVPHERGLWAKERAGEDAIGAALEGNDGLAAPVDPDAQVDGEGVRRDILGTHGELDRAPRLDGTEGEAVSNVTAVVNEVHSLLAYQVAELAK